MFSRLLPHFRHNVVAYLALFFALGGGAMAARPLITGADVQDGTLNSADLRDRGSASYPGPSIQGTDLEANTLTGAEINESSLGKVGDADTLDGHDSTAFGSGAMIGRSDGDVFPSQAKYAAASGNSAPVTDVIAAAQLSPHSTTVARDLSLKTLTAFNEGENATFTLYAGGQPTSVECQVVQTTALPGATLGCNSGTATATIPAGTDLALGISVGADACTSTPCFIGPGSQHVKNVQFGWRATTP